MRRSVLNDRTSSDPARRQPGDTLSGFIDLCEEFTIPQAPDGYHHGNCFVSFQTSNAGSKAQRQRSNRLVGRDRARIHYPLCGGWRACRTAATNIKFSGRSGCSQTSAVHTLCRVWQLRKGDRAAQKPKKAAAGFRCLTPPSLRDRHADCGQSKAPFTTCAAGPAWQKPRPARPQNGEASRLI